MNTTGRLAPLETSLVVRTKTYNDTMTVKSFKQDVVPGYYQITENTTYLEYNEAEYRLGEWDETEGKA